LRETDVNRKLGAQDYLFFEKYLLLRKGKKNYALVQFD